MQLFLTGSTGFVGSEVLKQLTKQGHIVRCLVRKGAERKLKAKKNVEIVNGDINDPQSLAGKMEGCAAVVHLVGIIRAFPGKGITFEKIHFEGSKNVIDEARQAGVRRILHMSALGARDNAESKYHQTKYAAEQYLQESGLTYTIFRPSIIFGPDDAFVNMLAGMIRLSPVIPVIGNGKYKMQPVAVENVAQGFVRALDKEIAQNNIYEVGGPDQLEYNQLLDIIAKQLGRKIIKIHQPICLMKPVVSLLEDFSFFPLTKDQLIMLQEGSICNYQKFSNELGIKLISFAEGIKKWL